MPFIFLSYSHKDSEYANRVADSLEAKGLEVWIDERIDYGARWPKVIQENLDRCSAFVVVMTPDSFESEWVQAELTRARRLRKPTFPLLLEGDVWLALEATHYVDVRGGKLPPARFYNGLAGVLSVGQAQGPVAGSQRERLQGELEELQRRYDNLTGRIKNVDTDLGRELDGERRGILEERRAELATSRDKTAGRMAEIEKQLAQIAEQKPPPMPTQEPKPAKKEPIFSPRTEDPPATRAKVEPLQPQVKPPASTVRTEAQAPAKVAPVSPLGGALVTIDQPIHLELIRIPAGEFLMGDNKQRIDVAEFYIGKHPVTNAQYAAFVQAKKYGRPGYWQDGRIPAGKENHPVVYVSWHDAVAFCEWLSQATGRKFRLPTEAEWEKAARGGLRISGPAGALMDNSLPARKYPWGDEFDSAKCNTRESGIKDTTPVGKYSPAGDSPNGVADMAGNVWEWTSSLPKPYPYDPKDGREDPKAEGLRVLRGGSWSSYHNFAASAYRLDCPPDYRLYVWGFRVVAGLAPAF